MPKILFVCQANVNRSQMAEAFIRKLLPEIEVKSAAAEIPPEWEGECVAELSHTGVEVMKEKGIDMSKAAVKKITKEVFEEADMVISMVKEADLPEYAQESPKITYWHVEDPGGQPYETYVKVRDLIEEMVKAFVEIELKKES